MRTFFGTAGSRKAPASAHSSTGPVRAVRLVWRLRKVHLSEVPLIDPQNVDATYGHHYAPLPEDRAGSLNWLEKLPAQASDALLYFSVGRIVRSAT